MQKAHDLTVNNFVTQDYVGLHIYLPQCKLFFLCTTVLINYLSLDKCYDESPEKLPGSGNTFSSLPHITWFCYIKPAISCFLSIPFVRLYTFVYYSK
jgi:hypothetical protein